MQRASVHANSSTLTALHGLWSDTVIYAIRFADPNIDFDLPRIHEDPHGRAKTGSWLHGLGRLPDWTGGALFDGPRSLDPSFDLIENDLRNQYSIGFKRGQTAPLGEFNNPCNRSKKALYSSDAKGIFWLNVDLVTSLIRFQSLRESPVLITHLR